MLRVRFAPSPTGFLHIGSARTFIFNWLYARRNHGTMVLRIDDTDVDRNTQASLDSIFEGLKWLDLGWDEEYHQSNRLELHQQMAWAIFEIASYSMFQCLQFPVHTFRKMQDLTAGHVASASIRRRCRQPRSELLAAAGGQNGCDGFHVGVRGQLQGPANSK